MDLGHALYQFKNNFEIFLDFLTFSSITREKYEIILDRTILKIDNKIFFNTVFPNFEILSLRVDMSYCIFNFIIIIKRTLEQRSDQEMPRGRKMHLCVSLICYWIK